MKKRRRMRKRKRKGERGGGGGLCYILITEGSNNSTCPPVIRKSGSFHPPGPEEKLHSDQKISKYKLCILTGAPKIEPHYQMF